MLFVSSSGHGKRTKLDMFNRQGRGGQGVRGMKVTASRGGVVAAFTVAADDEILVFSSGGNIIRMGAKEISSQGRDATGVRVARLGSRGERRRGGAGARSRDARRGQPEPMGSAADDIGPETAVRPPPRDPARGSSVRRPSARREGGTGPAGTRRDRGTPRPSRCRSPSTERRYRQTINRVDLWSVLKISLCFYICGMAVIMVALVALWVIADAAGVIHSVEKFIGDLLQTKDFKFLVGGDPARARCSVGRCSSCCRSSSPWSPRVLQPVRRALRRHRDHDHPRTNPRCSSRPGAPAYRYAQRLSGAIAQSVRAHP